MFSRGKLLVLLLSCGLVRSLSIDSNNVLSRSKRQLKTLCSATLYNPPLNKICSIPKEYSHSVLVKKYVDRQNKTKLSKADSVAVFNGVYFEKKWVDGKGVLNQKNIETDVVALTTDPEWKKITKIVANRCFKEVIDAAKLSVISGYKTSCKLLAPYMFQTCFMVKLYNNCPVKQQKADYADAVTALVGCDATALVKTIQDTAKSALKNLANSNLDSSLKKLKSNSKAIEAELPSEVMDQLKSAAPKGSNLDKIDGKQLEKDIKDSSDPMALAKKFKVDTGSLDFLGK